VCQAWGEIRSAYKILFDSFQEKRPLGRSRSMWKDNIKIDLIGTDRIQLAQDTVEWLALVNMVINLRVP
jgi:hypothetical protein